METRTAVVCGACGVFWTEGVDPTGCDDVAHEHQRFELHVHRTSVTLADGTTIGGVSFDAADPYRRDVDGEPAFGVYLDPKWQPPWPHTIVDWPDFGVPADRSQLATVLGDLLARARAGELVEVGCLGGHGRTGTALACLAILAGTDPGDAVAWVRSAYCVKAVETPEQEAFVAGFTA